MNARYQQQIREILDAFDFSSLAGTSVLLTGATGMIGSAIVDILMQMGTVDVYALGRSASRGERRFPAYWKHPRFHFLAQDITEPLKLAAPCDYFIHAASPAYPAAFAAHPVETMTANFEGMYHVLEAARECQARRVLYVSSGEVYGEITGDAPKTEQSWGFVDPLLPRSCYPQSKRAAETLCTSYRAEYGVDVVIARPSHVYGSTMTTKDNRAVSDFLRRAAAGEDIIMHSLGAVVRSYTYALDAASGILTVLLRGTSGEAYNVADDRTNLSIREIATQIALVSGKKLVIDLPNANENTGYTTITRQVMDATRLRRLGWKALTDIKHGVRDTLEILQDGALADGRG